MEIYRNCLPGLLQQRERHFENFALDQESVKGLNAQWQHNMNYYGDKITTREQFCLFSSTTFKYLNLFMRFFGPTSQQSWIQS